MAYLRANEDGTFSLKSGEFELVVIIRIAGKRYDYELVHWTDGERKLLVDDTTWHTAIDMVWEDDTRAEAWFAVHSHIRNYPGAQDVFADLRARWVAINLLVTVQD